MSTRFVLLTLGLLFAAWGTSRYPFDIKLYTGQKGNVEQEFVIPLVSLGLAGQTGKAFVRQVDGRVVVNMRMDTAPQAVIQPVGFYRGNCQKIGEAVYALAGMVDGKSTTTYYELSLDDVKKNIPLVLVVSSSRDEQATRVSCGEVIL